MQGTILDLGIISADDGNRYYYTALDIKEPIPLQKGDRVDFVIENNNAKDIFLLFKQKSSSAFEDNSKEIGILKLLGIIACIVAIVSGFNYFVLPLNVIIFLYVYYRIDQISKNSNLFKNYLISILVFFLSICFIFVAMLMILGISFSTIWSFNPMSFNSLSSLFIGFSPFLVIFLVLIMFAGGIISYIYLFKTMSELSEITNEKFFYLYAILYAIGFVTFFFFIGIFILILANIIFLIGWFRLKEIKKI